MAILNKVDKTFQNTNTIGNWREILSSLGYPLPAGDKVRTRAIYRGGDSNNALLINFTENNFYDFPEKIGGPLSKLFYLTTGKYIENTDVKTISFENRVVPEKPITASYPKYYPEESLARLIPDYDYFINNRKISRETLKKFEAGLATKGAMYGRMVFPIRDPENGRIVGCTGRINKEVDKDYKFPKWIHSDKTANFIYNSRIAFPAIKETGEVILCESVGDVLSLHEAGIKNVLCLFGLNLSAKLLKYLLILNPNKIIISTNNDENLRGNVGAEKLKNQLLTHFNPNKIKIELPPENNDWNDELKNNGKNFIKEWYVNLDKSIEKPLQNKQNSISYPLELDYYQ